jgi:hypothetical protein
MMTAHIVESSTGKDAINVATTEVTEQETSGQVAPKQDAATTSLTQSGLPDTAARVKMVVRPSTVEPSQEQEQTGQAGARAGQCRSSG